MSQNPIERVNLGLSVGAVAVSWLVAPPPFASGVTVGAVLGAVNFRALRGGAERLFAGGTPGGGPAMVGFGLRFVLLAAVLAVAMNAGQHPVGLLLGVSLIVPSAVIGTLMQRPAPTGEAPGLASDDPAWEDWNPWLARDRVTDAEDES